MFTMDFISMFIMIMIITITTIMMCRLSGVILNVVELAMARPVWSALVCERSRKCF